LLAQLRLQNSSRLFTVFFKPFLIHKLPVIVFNAFCSVITGYFVMFLGALILLSCKQKLQADDIAETVVFILSAKPHVQVVMLGGLL